MTCDAAIRPFPHVDPSIELRCDATGPGHTAHAGDLRDYAYPGSLTRVVWQDDDRRNYTGTFPGYCSLLVGCSLPAGHPRKCAP